MNIVQMHLGVKARLDQISTPRFKDNQIDTTINNISNWIVRNKVDGTIENGKRTSFQKTQVIRDELYTIVKQLDTTGSLSVNADNKTIESLPSDYRYLLGLEIQINSVAKDWCAAISYDELFDLNKDPHKRPSQDFPYQFYYFESEDGLETVYDQGSSDVLNYARIYYLADPITVYLGTKKGFGTVLGGTNVIAYTDCIYNSISYKAGTAFTVVTAGLFTSGTAVQGFVNSDLPPSLHDEIIYDSAKSLNTDVENYNKWKVMKEEEMSRKR